jgi:HSP20 family protein
MITNKDTRELKAKEKHSADTMEQTVPGPYFVPAVDIFETDRAITLLADLPGVQSDGLDVDLKDNVLTLMGDVAFNETPDEETILMEYEVGKYYRQFSLSDIIDQANIDASLKEGVLRLTLPKAEKAQPRKITVNA